MTKAYRNISEFEKGNTRLKHHSIDIPDQLLACKLLFCARLDERDKKLMLTATPDLKYDSIKTNLKRVFASTPSSSCVSQNMTIVKNEAVLRQILRLFYGIRVDAINLRISVERALRTVVIFEAPKSRMVLIRSGVTVK